MVEANPPLLPVALKRSTVDLYRTFLLSPNFASWLSGKTADVYRLWKQRYIKVLCSSNISTWAESVDQVEIVDLFMRIGQELV